MVTITEGVTSEYVHIFPSCANLIKKTTTKNSIIGIKLFIFNFFKSVYNDLKVKKKKKVLKWFCGGCALKWNNYNPNSSDEGFWKFDSNQCWVLL